MHIVAGSDKRENLNKRVKKYLFTTLILALCGQMVFSGSLREVQRPERRKAARAARAAAEQQRKDTLRTDSLRLSADSLLLPADSLHGADSLAHDSLARDTAASKPFLDDVISGKNTDSLVYDLKNKTVYIYNEGDVTYQDMNLKADFMRINMDTKQIYAYGKPDSTGKGTRPEFVQGGASYTMDTIRYNIDSKKAKIRNVATQEGEGYLIGQNIKKMPDNTINIANGKYTTCDNVEHPHFYMALTKAKAIPGKKVIVGPSYFVMEDVPIYFLGVPFGFFPLSSGRHSGFIMPEYGEEYVKGFFLRNGGYYFAFNDYIDVAATGGFYTLGSWEAALASNYVKRYKYRGAFNMRFSKDIIGEKGAADYVNQNNFNVTWTHTQDPKFRPNSTFSASVNFSTSGYSKYGSTNLNDYLNTQTNSSIAYSKTWAGKPFSFSTNFQHSQNSADTTISLSFPNIVFNISRIYPFRRKEAIGKQRWYEKISMQYTGTLANNVTVKERDLFTEKMFKEMKNGVQHTIPIQTSINLFNYINISPSANYTERWYFKKIDKAWDPEQNRIVNADTTYGFYRLYDYRFSVSASTKVYGMFTFGKKSPVQAIRHVMTPSISFSYTPDFGDPKYGYYKPIQSDSTGTISYYSPFEGGMYGLPGRSRSASISFSLQNTLEMKVKSKKDTSGVKKIKLIDNFSISSSYNLLADSLNLSPFSLNLRTTIYGNFGLNLSATLDPYEVDEKGRRINRFMIKRGKLGRITNTGWSFGYTFNSKKSNQPAANDINSQGTLPPDNPEFFTNPEVQELDPNTRRALMTSQYYDFSIPWNLGFNYSLSYTNNGIRKNVIQTLGFNGSINLTPKWGITFNGGYDFESRQITPGVITIARDLHCWQMNFSWVPVGFRKSWNFNIAVKSAMLKDLKYEKQNSFYDNLYD